MRFFPSRIHTQAFTLVELMVVVAIIGILTSIVYANFGQARATSRDEVRKTAVKDLELAIKLYKAQNGAYPAQGCGTGAQFAGPGTVGSTGYASCDNYITGLTPDFIAELPKDPRSEANGVGFFYRSNGTDFKLMVYNSLEVKRIASYSDEFSRCSTQGGAVCPVISTNSPVSMTYAVYSTDAAAW